MKKFVSILAIAFVSLNFVSCREDDAASDIEVASAPQPRTNYNKNGDTIKTDSTAANTSALQRPEVDPDPPVKDGTRW